MTYKLPEGWEEIELEKIVQYETGKLNSNAADVNGKYPFFTCAPKPLKINKYKYDKEAIILAGNNAGGVFHVNRYNGKFNAYQRTYIMETKNDSILTNTFLYYLLIINLNHFKTISSGSATRFLTRKIIDKIKLNLPPLPEQKLIADTLSALDDKIENNNKINENLEKQAQAIFKNWFVDFEFPDENGNPYKSSGGEMVESELGMIPKGWEVVELGDIITICNGKRPKVKVDTSDKENRYPILGASGTMGYTNDFLYNEPILVIGRVGTHGVVQKVNNKAWTSDNTMVIKSTYYEFANQVLLSLDYKSLNRGSTQPLLAQKDIKNQKIVIPSKNKEILALYESTFSEYRKQINTFQQQNQNLSQLRDTLLPKLMSGELRIPINNKPEN